MANRPRGTRDFAPDEMAARTWAAGRVRDVFRRYAYHEVQTPTFEELELFTAKSGEGIISELYDFTDKGGRRMTLRPELTAPTMRMYFADHAFDPKPIKWFYHGPCFRYDRPQEGRYREFWQFGCEQIGAGTPLAYAELIALGAGLFEELGLKDVEIRVGHVGVLKGLVQKFEFSEKDTGRVMRAIDKGDPAELKRVITEDIAVLWGPNRTRLLDELVRLLDVSEIGFARGLLSRHEDLFPHLNELQTVLNHLSALGVQPRLNLGIARGLDYYTGVVFEFHCKELEAQSQLLGGGGYDLSHVFGGQPTPTMGFGMGFDRTLVALEKQGVELPKAAGPLAYFGALSDAARNHVLGVVAQLRRAGVAVDVDLLGRKPNKIAGAAQATGARHLVMVGDRDLGAGAVQVKRLDTGDAAEVPVDGLVAYLREAAQAASSSEVQ